MEYEIKRFPVTRVVTEDVLEEAEEFAPVAYDLFRRIAQAAEESGDVQA